MLWFINIQLDVWYRSSIEIFAANFCNILTLSCFHMMNMLERLRVDSKRKQKIPSNRKQILLHCGSTWGRRKRSATRLFKLILIFLQRHKIFIHVGSNIIRHISHHFNLFIFHEDLWRSFASHNWQLLGLVVFFWLDSHPSKKSLLRNATSAT